MKSFPWWQNGLRTAVLLVTVLSVGSSLPAAEVRSYQETRVTVSIDGASCPVEAWAGGDPRGRVGTGKQITGVDVAPLTLDFPVPLPAPVQNWISRFFSSDHSPHNLVLTEMSANGQPVGTGVQLNNCVLTEVSFSGLDAASRVASRVSVVIQPGSWQKLATAGQPVTQTDTRGRPVMNFRLQLAGQAAALVSRIEGFTVRRPADGDVEFPNLLVTLSLAGAADWIAWRDTSLGLGTTGAITPQKKSGSLEYLDSAMNPGALTLQLDGLQIIRATRLTGAAEERGRIQAELLCDRITIAAVAAPAATTAPANQPPAAQPAPAESGTKAAPVASAEQGERDPTDFPRPEGMERQTFSASSSPAQQREYATYTAKAGFADMLARYDQLVEKAGWKPAYRTESGDSTANRMIIIEWHREAKEAKESVAEVRIYAAKTGSTVAVTVTTYKPVLAK